MSMLRSALLVFLSTLPGTVLAQQQLWFSDTTNDAVHVLDGVRGSGADLPIAFPAHQPLAPVASRASSHVYVQSVFGPIADIDSTTQTIIRTFDDPNPDAIGIRTLTISPDGKTLYATGPAAGTIALVDATSGAVTARVDISSLDDASPLLRASHDGRSLFLLDSGHASITSIDIATLAVGATVQVPVDDPADGLVWMSLSDDDRTLYTATKLGQFVRVDVPSMSIADSTKVASLINGLVVAPHAGHAFVTTTDAACLIDIDLSSGTTTATAVADDTCSFPLAISDDGSELFLSEQSPSDQSQWLLAYETGSRGVRFDKGPYSYVAFDDQSVSNGPIVPATGIWWTPGMPGSSFQIEVQSGTLVFVASSYDGSDEPTWRMASGPFDAQHTTFEGDLVRYEGSCLGCAYHAPIASAANGGNVAIAFSSATVGTLTYGGQAIPIVKYMW